MLAGEQAPASDGGRILVDIDATVVTSCSQNERAAPTWKKTYGFHPLTVFADHGAGRNGEPLAIMLRPGNAGPNTAAGHRDEAVGMIIGGPVVTALTGALVGSRGCCSRTWVWPASCRSPSSTRSPRQ